MVKTSNKELVPILNRYFLLTEEPVWNCNKVLCHDLAKQLSHYLYFFSFLIGLTTIRWSMEKYHVTLSQCHNVTIVWWMVTYGHVTVTVTECHMTRVTWGLWESKCIATVVKCISSRELSKNSIEFSLSNTEQRDSWLNSGHWTLDTDMLVVFIKLWLHRLVTLLINKYF